MANAGTPLCRNVIPSVETLGSMAQETAVASNSECASNGHTSFLDVY